ncbi:flagellar biosynthesis protein FlhF [Neobacillus novalis]|uniref:Flagellar biosynthesis protein FlhF n=1 Tax=Neobacillus novalis TaxID=220687 RepID=A0AA95MRP3_9BACI|nr:flagellar biosynthesis protein FlhF [Neobacillus novalis]WHY88415.1 flagellar biosynthesis protein FlhF [Neobacillus novalis]
MIIKTYVVDHISDAYPLIFQDLGKDAIILKTKPVKAAGFFWFLRRKKLEVVAASDLSAGESQKPAAPKPSDPEPEQVKMVSNQEVLKELSEVKGLIHSIVKGAPASKTIPQPLEKWVVRLRDQEVDEEVIQFLVKRVTMKYDHLEHVPSEVIEETFLTNVEELLEEGITKEMDSSPFLITLIGPTGVGKTTTIAKLAAVRVLQGRQRVGLLTTDTYRIAAVEQLKTYANILNVPVEVVTNPDGITDAVDGLKSCQVILMDSSGRNYLEDEYIEEINQYLHFDAPQENYLVLSMTTRWRDLKMVIEKMKSVPIDKLILTKWDETTCFGAALNILYHYPYPLSYISIGQAVPQDIMPATADYIAKKILGVDENAARPSI